MCIQNNVNQSLAVLMHNPRWPPLVSREAVISLSTNYIVFTFWCTHSPVQLEVICHVALEQTHNMSSYVLVITNINSFLRSSMYCLYCKATALEPIWSTKNQFESSASGSKHPRYVHNAWSWMQLQNGTFIDATTCDYAVVCCFRRNQNRSGSCQTCILQTASLALSRDKNLTAGSLY